MSAASDLIVPLGTLLGGLLASGTGAYAVIFQVRKTKVEIAKMQEAVTPDEAVKAASASTAEDSSVTALKVMVDQFQFVTKRCDQLSVDLDECRNRLHPRKKLAT